MMLFDNVFDICFLKICCDDAFADMFLVIFSDHDFDDVV